MSWNVENLFDTEHQEGKQDEEFTPEGKYEWTEEKLVLKMRNLAKVITSITNPDGSRCPDFLGMAEVENAQVARRLNREYLQICKYDKIIADPRDPDPRGIRAVSLTRLDLAERPRSIPTYPGGRFIQETKVQVNGHAMTIFMDHWKSRRFDPNDPSGGEDKRKECARALRGRSQQLIQADPHADFLAMGDFNDEPENDSLAKVLGSTPNFQRMIDDPEHYVWFNPSSELLRLPGFEEGLQDDEAMYKFRRLRGTFYYGKDKQYLAIDNFHYSPGLLDDEGFSYAKHSFEVVRHPDMTDPYLRPIGFGAGRTPRGASDHFPILSRFQVHE
jgi:hypothetical protein